VGRKMVRERSSSDGAQRQSGHHRRASPIRITATVNTGEEQEEQMEMLYASRRSWAPRDQLPLEAVAVGERGHQAIKGRGHGARTVNSSESLM
jgi:hypothetical protein